MRTTFVCSQLLIFTRDRKPHQAHPGPGQRPLGARHRRGNRFDKMSNLKNVSDGFAELAARNAPEARAGPDRATSGAANIAGLSRAYSPYSWAGLRPKRARNPRAAIVTTDRMGGCAGLRSRVT
jgi:hypothetical protein